MRAGRPATHREPVRSTQMPLEKLSQFLLNKEKNSYKFKRAGVIPFAFNHDTHQMEYCLAVDTRTGDLTDFGGQIKSKDARTICNFPNMKEWMNDHPGEIDVKRLGAVYGAYRELSEESMELFACYNRLPHINLDDILDNFVIYDSSNLIIFQRLCVSPCQISYIFRSLFSCYMNVRARNLKAAKSKSLSGNTMRRLNSLPEVCDVKWITLSQLALLSREGSIVIDGHKRELYSRVKEFTEREDLTSLMSF